MPDARAPKSATILIVDRDEKSREALKAALAEAHPDYTYQFAGDSREALESAKNFPPDLVFLDVVMPDNEGYDICLLLKADERYKDVPLLILTSLDRPDARIKGFRLGASDYLLKPVDKDETVARVEAQLRMKRYQDRQKELNEELRLTQSALLQSSKMSTAGTLAAGVAHEFNNLLHVINASAELCAHSESLEEVREMARSIQECARRGGRVAKSLLDFARKDEYQKKEKVVVGDLLRRDLQLLEKTFRSSGVHIVEKISPTPPVECFPGQLSQIFVNLVHNAVESMGESAEKLLEVSASVCDCADACASDRRRPKGRGCVVITFRDTGCGIPDKLKDKIFEPFVTTKGVVGGGNVSTPGTGLGLSISYGIAQRHGGTLRFDSQEGRGSTFTLNLPLA